MRIVGHCTYCGEVHELRDDEGFWVRCWEAARIEHNDEPISLKALVG